MKDSVAELNALADLAEADGDPMVCRIREMAIDVEFGCFGSALRTLAGALGAARSEQSREYLRLAREALR